MAKKVSNKNTISDLLKKYDLLDPKISSLLWQMNANKLTVDDIKKIYVFSEGLTEEQIAKEVFFLISKCDLESPQHDNDLYVSICTLGTHLIRYKTGHSNKYNGIPDDNYGFGTRYSHQLDTYNDGAAFDSEGYSKGIK